MQYINDIMEPHIGKEAPVIDIECRSLPSRDASVQISVDGVVTPPRIRAVSKSHRSHRSPTSFSQLISRLFHTVSS
jgi:hypothetical protein